MKAELRVGRGLRSGLGDGAILRDAVVLARGASHEGLFGPVQDGAGDREGRADVPAAQSQHQLISFDPPTAVHPIRYPLVVGPNGDDGLPLLAEVEEHKGRDELSVGPQPPLSAQPETDEPIFVPLRVEMGRDQRQLYGVLRYH